MCDVPTAPTSSAIAGVTSVVRCGSVAFDATPAGEHHADVLLLADTGLLGGELLEGHAIAGGELEGVIDVAAQLEHAQPVACEHSIALLGRELEPVEVALLVGAERL